MTAYYNEIDPFAAAWLRELIKAGHIAPGVVDERDIRDVRPADLDGFTQCHFFAGIGVWSYALRRAGWPDHRPVWTASCPCQPFSAAGRGIGFADERHLWPHFFHLVGQCHPDVVLGEQVASKDGLAWIELVQSDLEGAGYAVGAVDTCAAGFGAPHIRQRLYWTGRRLEHAKGDGRLEWRPEPSGRSAAGGRGFGGLGHHHHHQGLEGQRSGHQAESGRVGEVRPVAPASEFGRLADAEGEWRRERSGQVSGTSTSSEREMARQGYGDATRANSTVDRLADADDHQSRQGRDAGTATSEGLRAELGGRGDVRGLADANGVGAERGTGYAEETTRVPQGQREPEHRPDVSQRGGDDSHGRGTDRRHGLSGHNARTRPTNGFWRDPDWLFCRDGKWRPVEPGTFPLAHGAATRVGRLRGYGNAINAEQAQGFIEAVIETGPLVDIRLSGVSVSTQDMDIFG